MFKILAFSLIFLCFSSTSHSRSPAVEPVMGISIEEIDHVHPDQAIPFDFSNAEGASRSPAIEVETNYDFAAPPRSQASNESSNLPIPIIGLALILPLFIWFAILKDIKPGQDLPTPLNGAIDLEARREAMKTSEKDHDKISKAS